MTGLMWLGLLIIIVVCFSICNYDSINIPLSGIAGIIAAIVLVIMLFVWPIVWYENRVFRVIYEMTEETIEAARGAEDTGLERAALIHKVVKINQRLAVKKYWNDGLWDWYIPDDVANLEPIH